MKTLLPVFILLLSFYQTSIAQIVDSVNIDFEQPSDLIVLGTAKADTLWQIGTPSKPVFNAAHSGSKAIMTDTLKDYPAGVKAFFILKIPPALQPNDTYLSFWQRFDTENGKDSGNIEVSYDKGVSWEPMVNSSNWDQPPLETDWKNTDSSGTTNTSDLKITGDSRGWTHSTFHWLWLLPVKANDGNNDSISRPISNALNYAGGDTLLVRFSFYSDTVQRNHEGWMIDDITVTGEDISGIDYHQADNKEMRITPNPVQDLATVSLPKPLKVRQYIIYDQLGEIVMKKPIENTSFQINTSLLPEGVYFLSVIYDNNKSLIRKFVKK